MDLKDVPALVTGAARRIGRATALELAAAGCHVAVHCHDSGDEAQEAADEIRRRGRKAVVLRQDLSDLDGCPSLVERAASELGGLGVLVNNAAVFPREDDGEAKAFDEAHWLRLLRINLLAPVCLAEAAAVHLRRARGRVVNLLDTMMDSPPPGLLAYAVSKAALAAATRGLARKLSPEGLAFGIAPGIILFPEGDDTYDAATRDRLVKRIPAGRTGTPEELARLIRALLESGDFVNGEIVRADGGRHLV